MKVGHDIIIILTRAWQKSKSELAHLGKLHLLSSTCLELFWTGPKFSQTSPNLFLACLLVGQLAAEIYFAQQKNLPAPDYWTWFLLSLLTSGDMEYMPLESGM